MVLLCDAPSWMVPLCDAKENLVTHRDEQLTRVYRKHRSYIPYLRTTQCPTLYVNLRRDKWLPLSGKQQRVYLQYLMRNEKLRQHREGRMQAAMAKKKRHSRVEIATKLAQATDLTTQGKSQREIAHTLGVSVMTLHRWRKVPPGPQTAFVATHEARRGDRIAELQLENLRLRRLVTDLLLEKIRLEEAAQTSKCADVDVAQGRIERAGTVGLRDARELPIQPDRAQEGRARVI
jgi:putative transposase